MELVTTPTEVAPRGRLTVQPPATRPPRGPRRIRPSGPGVGLVLLLALTLGLRLWGIGQGLPFSYNVDEAQHFVPKAIGFFAGDWNPHYFLNPPGFSYMLAIVFEGWFGSADAAVRSYTLDPSAVFTLARVTCAVLGTAAVWLLYRAGVVLIARRWVALLAAAIFGTAFLPIYYSHLALNDVPTLFWVCVALRGVAGVWREDRGRDYLLAGLGLGVASATKYTGGWVVVPLLVAAARAAHAGAPANPRRRTHALGWTAGALLVALGAFSLANPYWFLDFPAFVSGIGAQASAASGASEPAKLGTTPGGGILYYLWTFTWGLGLGPALAALAAAVGLLWQRRLWLFGLLVPGPVAFLLFMGLQERYFGRWLMPIFPVVALLGAWGAGQLVDWGGRLRRPLTAPWAGALVAVALLTQSLVSVLHDDRVLARPYTTNLARAWMTAHIPAGQNVYIEPVVPGNWTSDPGRTDPFEPNGARWYQYPTWLSTLSPSGRVLPDGGTRPVTLDQYEKTLYPGLIQRFEAHAFCWVVSGSLQSGRAFVSPGEAPAAIAYYRELARVGQLVFRVSPYAPGATPVPFGFDWSIDEYPSQYRLPGPVISIYRLHGGACAG
ncbi:MAG TPA: glycosyltransferase family 39 protein [Solirubrobacteraceae bacterium]|nr:glycosyltransferase family 39 protein [Solirubrobacteraceae bacterium]